MLLQTRRCRPGAQTFSTPGRLSPLLSAGFSLLLFLSLLSCSQVDVIRIEQGDSFEQQGGHVTLDVLWVIDNSGTMSEEQAALKLSLGTFVDEMLGQDIDFHLGVITMDLSDPLEAGILLGDPPFLTRDTPELRATFVERAVVGFSGDRIEQGFSAALSALTPPLSIQENSGFLRSNAELAIVFVSDEDDQSSITVGQFLTELQGLKASTDVTVSALVGDVPLGCVSSTGAADAGARFLQAVESSGGVGWSICQAPFDTLFGRMVRQFAHLQDTFLLTRLPDPESIEVRVDDVLLHNREVDGWIYLSDINAVRIVGTPFPLAGQTVNVQYSPFRI